MIYYSLVEVKIMKDILTTKEAIEYTGLSRYTLYRKIKQGELKVMNKDRNLTFSKLDLDIFLNNYRKNLDLSESYTLDDIVDILGCSKRTLFRRIESGKLKAYKIGIEWRVLKSDFKAYLKAKK